MDNRRKIVRLVIIFVCLYLIVTTVSGIGELLGAGNKVTEREKRLAALRGEREKLLSQQAKAGTLEFLEEAAYDKLGLSRPGEKVVIVPQNLLEASKPEAATVSAEPNWKKWWKLIYTN